MASRLARNSRISLSTVGSGIGLSLILGGMDKKFLPSFAIEIKELLCALIPLDTNPKPSGQGPLTGSFKSP
jgi:hypothetical protein